MRTTVTIDDQLLREAKHLATETGRTLGDVVDDGLRVLLGRRAHASEATIDRPTYGGSGLRPGVDLEDKDALAELLDSDGANRAAG